MCTMNAISASITTVLSETVSEIYRSVLDVGCVRSIIENSYSAVTLATYRPEGVTPEVNQATKHAGNKAL